MTLVLISCALSVITRWVHARWRVMVAEVTKRALGQNWTATFLLSPGAILTDNVFLPPSGWVNTTE